MKKIYIGFGVLVAAVVVFFVITTPVDAADPNWQVDHIGCHGGVSHFKYVTLEAASQFEVDSIITQVTHPGTYNQVRLTRIDKNNPNVTYLISKNNQTCP